MGPSAVRKSKRQRSPPVSLDLLQSSMYEQIQAKRRRALVAHSPSRPLSVNKFAAESSPTVSSGSSSADDMKDAFYTGDLSCVANPGPKKCAFCSREEDDVDYGGDEIEGGWLNHPLILNASEPPRVAWVHRVCAAFSSQVYSSGPDEWFNVLREVRRGRCLKCFICGAKGATMTCGKKMCRATVHIPCALQTAQKWRPIMMADMADPMDVWHCDRHIRPLKALRTVENDYSRGRERYAVTFSSFASSHQANSTADAVAPNERDAMSVSTQPSVQSFDYITKVLHGAEVQPNRNVRALDCCDCLDCDTSAFCACKHRRVYLPNNGGIMRMECNLNCRCNKHACTNRQLAQNPRYTLALLARNDGTIGVCSQTIIPPGEVVVELIGVLSDPNGSIPVLSQSVYDGKGGFVHSVAAICAARVNAPSRAQSRMSSREAEFSATLKEVQVALKSSPPSPPTSTVEKHDFAGSTLLDHHDLLSVTVSTAKLGIELAVLENMDGVFVTKVLGGGEIAKHGNVWPGDLLVGVGSHCVDHLPFARVVQMIRLTCRPTQLHFRRGESSASFVRQTERRLKESGVWRELTEAEIAYSGGTEGVASYVESFSLETLQHALRIRANPLTRAVEIDELRGKVPSNVGVECKIVGVGMEHVTPQGIDHLARLFSTDQCLSPVEAKLKVQVCTKTMMTPFMNYFLDSRKEGNVSRFIRYVSKTEEPAVEVNVKLDAAFVESSCPRFFLRTIRDIQPGEELVYAI